jgi:hypothetical protein
VSLGAAECFGEAKNSLLLPQIVAGNLAFLPDSLATTSTSKMLLHTGIKDMHTKKRQAIYV